MAADGNEQANSLTDHVSQPGPTADAMASNTASALCGSSYPDVTFSYGWLAKKNPKPFNAEGSHQDVLYRSMVCLTTEKDDQVLSPPQVFCMSALVENRRASARQNDQAVWHHVDRYTLHLDDEGVFQTIECMNAQGVQMRASRALSWPWARSLNACVVEKGYLVPLSSAPIVSRGYHKLPVKLHTLIQSSEVVCDTEEIDAHDVARRIKMRVSEHQLQRSKGADKPNVGPNVVACGESAVQAIQAFLGSYKKKSKVKKFVKQFFRPKSFEWLHLIGYLLSRLTPAEKKRMPQAPSNLWAGPGHANRRMLILELMAETFAKFKHVSVSVRGQFGIMPRTKIIANIDYGVSMAYVAPNSDDRHTWQVHDSYNTYGYGTARPPAHIYVIHAMLDVMRQFFMGSNTSAQETVRMTPCTNDAQSNGRTLIFKMAGKIIHRTVLISLQLADARSKPAKSVCVTPASIESVDAIASSSQCFCPPVSNNRFSALQMPASPSNKMTYQRGG